MPTRDHKPIPVTAPKTEEESHHRRRLQREDTLVVFVFFWGVVLKNLSHDDQTQMSNKQEMPPSVPQNWINISPRCG